MSDMEVRQLSRHLSRLENTLITNPDPSLRRSHAKRTSLAQTLDQARSLLIELENSPNQDPQSKRHAALKRQRALLQQLQNRLHSLQDIAADDSDEDSDDGARSISSLSSTEDLLATYAPAIKDTTSGLDVKSSDSIQPKSGTSNAQLAAAGASLATTLRARQAGGASTSTDTATTTGRSTDTTTRDPRLASIPPFSPAPSKNEGADTATLMQHHDSEQDVLTSSLLTLASALKASTQSFSDSITASNPLVDQTTTSLDKNISGLDAASRGMGQLRGRRSGWANVGGMWGGLMDKLGVVLGGWFVWAQILALWIILVAVVLFLPRLRF